MRHPIRSGLSGAALSVLALLAASAVHAQTAPRPVKIGVLSDFSSQFSFYTGKYALEGVQLAAEDFMAAHPGRKVEVISADHQNKPDVGSGIARNWFDNDGVDVIADLPTSPVALAVMPIATEHKKILLATTALTLLITNERCNGLTARFSADAHSMDSSVNALVAQGKDSFFFVSWDNAAGIDAENDSSEMVKAGGGKVLGAVRFPLGVADMSSFVLQAQQSHAQVIAFGAGGGDLVKGIKAAAEFGVMPGQSVVGLNMSLADLHNLGLQTAQGLYYADGFYWDRTDATRAFARRYFERNGGTKMPDNVAAANYSAALHYLEATLQASPDDAFAVMKRMQENPVNDVYTTGGVLRPDGQMVHDTFLLQAKAPADSHYPWDYARVIATIPAAQSFLPLSRSRCPLVPKS